MQLQIALSTAIRAPFGFDCGISTKTDPAPCLGGQASPSCRLEPDQDKDARPVCRDAVCLILSFEGFMIGRVF